MLKRIPISSNDFSLFDAELNSYEYEYFCKHIGAFKRFMQEEPKEQRQLFLDAFCEYSYNHVEIKAIATMSDPKKKFIESFRQYTQGTFINGKFSVAKQFLNDSVIVARNKHMIQYMDSHSYAKDPFFHKDTRDVFRRLFGEPTEAGTCVKVICVLPLYVRFAGSICRYLKKWLDMEESLYPIPVKGKKSKAEKKALKEQALAAANAAKTLAIAQQTKPAASKPALKLGAAAGNAKSGSASGQKSTVAGSSSKTVGNDDKSKAIVSLEDSKPTQAELDAAEDFSNYYYDLHERKQRKRDIRKKGKKHEHVPCQHPCHGKICNCNPHKHVHTHDHTHDHTHEHHHHHSHDPPQATREELMNCLCERHKALAEAKIAEKRAALQKQNMQSDGKQPADKSPEGDKNSSDKIPEDKSSDVKTTENANSEDKSPRVETSDAKELEGKSSEETNEKSVNAKDKCSEDKTSEDANSINEEHPEKKLAGGESQEDNSSKDKNSSSKSSEEDKNLEDKSSEEDKNLDDKSSEGNVLEGDEKPKVKSPGGKKSHKKILENGVVSSEDSSDCDEVVERFVRRTFPELLLQEPHPNQVYKQMVAEEKEKKEKLKESKLRTCAFCRSQETEAKTFKKCQKCKGKGTKFYCSRECQKLDWTKHRLEH